jgi:hypothetical protein
MERVFDLTVKLADEGLSAEEQGELERLIEAEPLARRRHLQLLEVEAALRSARYKESAERLATAPSDSLIVERRVASVLQAVRKPAPLFSWKPGYRARSAGLVLAFSGLAAAMALVAARPRARTAEGHSGPMARSAVRPSAARHEIPSRRGWASAVLPVQGATFSDRVSFELGEGATLEVRGRAVLGLERAPAMGSDDGPANRVTLEEGTVAIERSSAAQTAISTPHGEILMRSGRAVITVSADRTRLQLAEGQATASTRLEGRPSEVSARHTAIIADGRAIVVPTPAVLFIDGLQRSMETPKFVDDVMVRRLEMLGFVVDSVDERRLRPEHVANHQLVVISPTVTARMHGRMADLALLTAGVPILCSRPALYEDLGMTAPGKQSAEFSNQKRYVTIVDHEHPLAAGLEGEVEVLDANMNVGWGIPAPGAARVAVLRDRRERTAIFAYDRGVPLLPPAGRAPARRVGFFLHPTGARFMNEQAWRLFDAAVKWAAEDALRD